jgi:flagellar protein FlgJ
MDAIAGVRGAPAAERALREAARGFEAIFMQMLLKSMRSTVHPSEFFHGGRGEDVFTGVLDEQLAGAVAGGPRGLGMAELIVKKYAAHAAAFEAARGSKLEVTR